MKPGELVSAVEGDIEKVNRVMQVTEIRVHYKHPLPKDQQETAQRVLETHASGCPAHNSVKGSIRIKIDAEYDLV